MVASILFARFSCTYNPSMILGGNVSGALSEGAIENSFEYGVDEVVHNIFCELAMVARCPGFKPTLLGKQQLLHLSIDPVIFFSSHASKSGSSETCMEGLTQAG